MARYPIKQLQDKNRLPFFPFNTLESVLVDGTDKNLADVLNDIYTKEEVNEIIAAGLSDFAIYDSVSDLPETAREGNVGVVITGDTYVMYMFYDDSWHTLTQKGDTGPYFTPAVDASGNISWTNNGGLPNPTTQNIKGPAGQDGQDGQDGRDGQDGFSPIANVTKSGTTATITITDAVGTTTATVSDGTNGTNGQDGAAATITVGTVTTGQPGTSASVTNSGTTSAAVFDFVIPEGQPGQSGSSSWGSITGTLSNQTDLQNALNAKLDNTLQASKSGNSSSSAIILDGLTPGIYPITSTGSTIYYKLTTTYSTYRSVSTNYNGGYAYFIVPKTINVASLTTDEFMCYLVYNQQSSGNTYLKIDTLAYNNTYTGSIRTLNSYIMYLGSVLTTGSQTISGTKTFSTAPLYSGSTFSNTSLVTKTYVDGLVGNVENVLTAIMYGSNS